MSDERGAIAHYEDTTRAPVTAELAAPFLRDWANTSFETYSAVWRELQAIADLIEQQAQTIERLEQEAKGHAQEARTANATIADIYQICSGGKGEPGNWHGAQPVRQRIAELERALGEIGSRHHADTCSQLLVVDCLCDCHVSIALKALEHS